MRTGFLAVSGWLVAAVLAVGISWSAIDVVRDSVSAGQPVVETLPASDETVGATASPTGSRPTTGPTAAPTVGALVTKVGVGGTVTARCERGRPRIVTIVPRQGFQADTDDSGAEVQFRSSDHRTEMKVTCSGLRATITADEHSSGGGGGDDHGGGSGRGGGGG